VIIGMHQSQRQFATLAATALLLAGVMLGGRSLATLVANWASILADAHDSWDPMRHALAVLRGGEPDSLYQKLFFQAGVKFQYPPASVLPLHGLSAFAPLSNPMLNGLNAFFFLLNAVLMAILAFVAFSQPSSTIVRKGTETAIRPSVAAALAFASAFAFFPLLRAFEIGQIQIWIDAAVTSACLLFLLDRKLFAGVVVAGVAAIKPQLGLLLLWAIAWRQWMFVKGFVAVGLPIAAASIALYGWQNHFAYLEVLSFISHHGESFYANHSVNGILNRLLHNGPILTFDSNAFAPYHPVVYFGTLISAAALSLLPPVLGALARGRPANIFDFGLACVCFTMAAPVAWEHHYGILLPFFVVSLAAILRDIPTERRLALLILLSTAWFLVASRIPLLAVTADTPLNIVFAHIFFGAALLLWVMWRASSVYRSLASDSVLDCPLAQSVPGASNAAGIR
jgi:alpha-1,2-mannosyltransferase